MKPQPEIDWSKVPQGTHVLANYGPDRDDGSYYPALFICPTTLWGLPEFLVVDEADGTPKRALDVRLASNVEVKKEWLK